MGTDRRITFGLQSHMKYGKPWPGLQPGDSRRQLFALEPEWNRSVIQTMEV
jgi:hypothetical protein